MLTSGGRTRSSAPALGQRRACGRLAASVYHRVLIVPRWRVVARRAVADGGLGSGASLLPTLPWRQRRTEEGERRKKEKGKGQPKFDSN